MIINFAISISWCDKFATVQKLHWKVMSVHSYMYMHNYVHVIIIPVHCDINWEA